MRIGELAKRTGLSRDTIRFYERQNLANSVPSNDPKNTYRDYPEELVERLGMITEAREAGMSIADLQLLTTCMDPSAESSFDADDFLDAKIRQVQQTIMMSRKFLSVLKATKTAINSHSELHFLE